MKSADQIVEGLLHGIAELYNEPQNSAYTLCGLDGLLFQLHWLYADATDRLDEFTKARMAVFESDLTGWQRVHRSSDFHRVIDEPGEFRWIVDEWKKLDDVFGIRPELDLKN